MTGANQIFMAGLLIKLLYNEPDLKIVANLGFDYKDVFNFLLGSESSRDLERVAKASFNMDYTDSFYGRNIFNNEIDYGIPDIMGGSMGVDPTPVCRVPATSLPKMWWIICVCKVCLLIRPCF